MPSSLDWAKVSSSALERKYNLGRGVEVCPKGSPQDSVPHDDEGLGPGVGRGDQLLVRAHARGAYRVLSHQHLCLEILRLGTNEQSNSDLVPLQQHLGPRYRGVDNTRVGAHVEKNRTIVGAQVVHSPDELVI